LLSFNAATILSMKRFFVCICQGRHMTQSFPTITDVQPEIRGEVTRKNGEQRNLVKQKAATL
jgi:hypothetical protein